MSSAPWAGLFSLAIAVAAAWLAVSTQPWAETVLLGGVGLAYFLVPPYGALPRSVLFLLGAALLLGLTAFLPAPAGGESVRQAMLAQGLVLPGSVSVQPWWSLEDWSLMAASFLWAWYCFESRFSVEQRRFLLASFLLATAAVAVATLLEGTAVAESLPPSLRHLGQFENRNQTGDILVMSGIFSFARGLSNLMKRRWDGLAWITLTSLFIAAIIRNESRSALIFFALGVLLFIVLHSRARHHDAAAWLLLLVLIVAGVCLFFSQGASLAGRFRSLTSGGGDYRLLIYQDASAMILHGPWCGVGLGNFEGFFNVQRLHSAVMNTRCLHPESDWLWLGAELGLGGILIFALLVFYGIRFYLGKSPFPGLTCAALVIAVVFLIHSLGDVGGHRLGTMWSCLFLVGLGAFRPPTPAVYKVPRTVLRLIGLVLLFVTGLRCQSMSLQPWMPTAGSFDTLEDALISGLSLEKQHALLDRALTWAPLSWRLYFQRGLVEEHQGAASAAAANDFNRTLFLDQNSTELPMAIGEACRTADLPEAMRAWQEALRRERGHPLYLYGTIYSSAELSPDQRLELATLAGTDPSLEADALLHQGSDTFDWMRQNFLANHPTLDGVDPATARFFFDHWQAVGDNQELLNSWPQHPEWHAVGWRAYARALAQAGRYPEAMRAVFQAMPAPQLPASPPNVTLNDAWRDYLLHPHDPFAGLQLYFAQRAAGQTDAALKTIGTVDPLPDAPPYVHYLYARDLSAAGQDQTAWTVIASHLE